MQAKYFITFACPQDVPLNGKAKAGLKEKIIPELEK